MSLIFLGFSFVLCVCVDFVPTLKYLYQVFEWIYFCVEFLRGSHLQPKQNYLSRTGIVRVRCLYKQLLVFSSVKMNAVIRTIHVQSTFSAQVPFSGVHADDSHKNNYNDQLLLFVCGQFVEIGGKQTANYTRVFLLLFMIFVVLCVVTTFTRDSGRNSDIFYVIMCCTFVLFLFPLVLRMASFLYVCCLFLFSYFIF